MLRRIGKWPWRRISAAIAVLVVAFCAATARLFIWPSTGMPAHVDAIVVLGGAGNRLGLGEKLAAEGRSRVLVLSEGLPSIPSGLCGQHDGAATVICFNPVPGNTQGEAEYVSRLAKQRGWRSLVLVTTPDQVWRAELRFHRCFSGDVYSVTTPLPADQWPYAIAYQWASSIKAETLNRSCLPGRRPRRGSRPALPANRTLREGCGVGLVTGRPVVQARQKAASPGGANVADALARHA